VTTSEPTSGLLRPEEGEVPVHRRVISFEVFERDDLLIVLGTLTDRRPWASGDFGPTLLHNMELAVAVQRRDLLIVAAEANMAKFPHAECPTIEDKFSELVGLSVGRGYTSSVQDRFGRERGCTHLEFLARALGPVVVQAVTSAAARRVENGAGENVIGEIGSAWLLNTCHIWAEGGIGLSKIEEGWRPGNGEYPAPSLVEIRATRS
jgi:Protein of unknown function (DUF2889)